MDVGLNAHAKSSVLYRRSVAGSFFTKFSLHDWLPTFLKCEWCLAAPFARAASSAFKYANHSTGSSSSSSEMIILRNSSHSQNIRVCMGIFTTPPRNKK